MAESSAPVSNFRPSIARGSAGPPTEMAARMRDEATDACRHGMWDPCARRLDEARSIDPRGESLPAIRMMRAAIDGNTLRLDAASFDGIRPTP
jgi:hypothetical protein